MIPVLSITVFEDVSFDSFIQDGKADGFKLFWNLVAFDLRGFVRNSLDFVRGCHIMVNAARFSEVKSNGRLSIGQHLDEQLDFLRLKLLSNIERSDSFGSVDRAI